MYLELQGWYFDMNKLVVIEQCIQNDLAAIKELEYHLNKLYEMRASELAKEEWEKALKEDFSL